MSMSDPVADMLTRIRNANRVSHESVDIPSSKLKCAIAQVLLREGFIKAWRRFDDSRQGILRVYLKYDVAGERVMREIRRVSKPGRRMYRHADELAPVREGIGIAILSTPKGVLSDAECRRRRVGGELLCTVW